MIAPSSLGGRTEAISPECTWFCIVGSFIIDTCLLLQPMGPGPEKWFRGDHWAGHCGSLLSTIYHQPPHRPCLVCFGCIPYPVLLLTSHLSRLDGHCAPFTISIAHWMHPPASHSDLVICCSNYGRSTMLSERCNFYNHVLILFYKISVTI